MEGGAHFLAWLFEMLGVNDDWTFRRVFSVFLVNFLSSPLGGPANVSLLQDQQTWHQPLKSCVSLHLSTAFDSLASKPLRGDGPWYY